MFWLNPFNFFLYVFCKIAPHCDNCRDYIINTYGDCYLNRNYNLYSILRMPRWIWSRVIIGGNYNLLVDTSRPECLHLVQEQEDDPSFFSFYVIAKLLFLISASVSVTYALLKVKSYRTVFRR